MIYLDNAATTPLTTAVKEYIYSIIDDYGNPSSLYSLGIKSKQIIDKARKNIYEFINADNVNSDIIFTSSGSASNSLAIIGVSNKIDNYFMFCSPTAHKSMLLSCKNSKYNHILNVDYNGEIIISDLENKLQDIKDEYVPIVCFEAANSEIGTIQDIDTITKLTHRYNGIVIVDFTGYIPSFKVDVKKLNIDIATFSGHKLHALKGIGVLYKKKSIDVKPIIYGSQENGLFGGTENVLGIASLGKAVETYNYRVISDKNRNYVFNYIKKNISEAYLIGSITNRLPNNLYICFKNIDAEVFVELLNIDGIAVSTGSACNSRIKTPSSTLLAINVNSNDIHSCVRFTFSGNETKEQLNYVCEKIKEKVELLRCINDKK